MNDDLPSIKWLKCVRIVIRGVCHLEIFGLINANSNGVGDVVASPRQRLLILERLASIKKHCDVSRVIEIFGNTVEQKI